MKNNGFSLLELSIVLVIIGLISGGIVAGASMIRAAELRGLITDITKFRIASHTFQDKYLGLPGDLKNATAFWGTMTTGTCPNATGGTGTQTCNGNGDGFIEFAGNANATTEWFLFWQHLANAGLIEGYYTGRAGTTNNQAITDENVPKSKMSGLFWRIEGQGSITGDIAMFDGTYKNGLILLSNGVLPSPALTPREMWNIDKKMDDGMPATGKLVYWGWNLASAGFSGYECSNASASDDFDAEYFLNSEETLCVLQLKSLQ